MRILTRYILREVTSHALLGGLLFTFIIFTRDLGQILDFVVRDSASYGDVARIILYSLPPILNVTIPMAVLVGILLGLSRLASDSEITAMRAAGLGAIDFVRIVSIVSAVALFLGLFNSLYLSPRGAAGLISIGDSLKTSQASFEVQPRVFYEEFKNRVLYVQDATAAAGAALWHHVFLADLTDPANPHITTASEAIVSGSPNIPDAQTIRLHLINGGQHEISSSDPNQYNITTFTTTDIPIETVAPEDAHLGRVNTPLQALTLSEVWRRGNSPQTTDSRERATYRIEFNRRFSYPFACLVLMLVAVPLGISSKRGGKSTGFVLTILLVFIYYFLSDIGVAFAQTGKLSPFLGVWGANLLFAAAGALLLYQMSRGGIALGVFSTLGTRIGNLATRILSSKDQSSDIASRFSAATLFSKFRSLARVQFPLLLDDYVMREYATNFAIILSTFSTLFLIFTFFELLGPIFRNRTPLVVVGEYLFNLIPFILYNVTPLCALVAVLVTFGSFNRTSEITAMKSAGISLYRIVTPVLFVTVLISAALFVFDEYYLPAANRRQEALLSIIKNKPAQTFTRPDRQWIAGQTGPGEPPRIFYYQYFNAKKQSFDNLTIFEFDPTSFTLKRRIFASSANWDPQANAWVFDNGWSRTFSGETVASHQPFTIATFPEIREQPAYFEKEALPSQEMSYQELSAYIDDLRQAGFDTKRLAVQLSKKIAYPLITFVMAILAIPFALSMGKKGSLTGIAVAIGLAITYYVVALVFESLGNVNTLPSFLAAWSPDLLFGITGVYLLLRAPT